MSLESSRLARKRFERPGPTAAWPKGTDGETVVGGSLLLKGDAFVEVLVAAFGPSGFERLEYWVKYIACVEDHNPWIFYGDLFGSWASSMRMKGQDQIGFSIDPIRILKALTDSSDISDVETLLSSYKNRVLPDWDLILFSRRGLLEIPAGSDFFPFVDGILLSVRLVRLQKFWRRLLSTLAEVDMKSITTYAETVILNTSQFERMKARLAPAKAARPSLYR